MPNWTNTPEGLNWQVEGENNSAESAVAEQTSDSSSKAMETILEELWDIGDKNTQLPFIRKFEKDEEMLKLFVEKVGNNLTEQAIQEILKLEILEVSIAMIEAIWKDNFDINIMEGMKSSKSNLWVLAHFYKK